MAAYTKDSQEADLKARWDDLTGWVVDDVKNKWWLKIKSAYSHPHRHYHTFEHLFNMFLMYDKQKDQLKNRLTYDPVNSQENETKSAQEFIDFSKETTFDDANYVANLIETTRSHCTEAHMQPDLYGCDDVHFLLDFDMAILGAEEAVYDDYAKKIRLEYGHLSDEVYTHDRLKILKFFLLIPNIFATKYFRDEFEQKARRNIQREIDRHSISSV